MSTEVSRDYSCKDEELTVIAGFVLQSYTRDLSDFFGFSPRFTEEYGYIFRSKIDAAKQLIAPEADTVEQTHATAQINNDSDAVLICITKLEAYLMLSKQIPLSATQFGINEARKCLHTKDTESKLNALAILNNNIAKYRAQLEAEGMNEALYNSFFELTRSIDEHKQLQYKIISNRRLRVQENIVVLNDLYAAMTEILNVGKALYKKQNMAKEHDYNFADLKKRVHTVIKPDDEAKAVQK